MRKMIPVERFLTATLRQNPKGNSITRILSAGLEAVDPAIGIKRVINFYNRELRIGNYSYSISKDGHVYMVAFGKASLSMAKALADVLGNVITSGIVVTKHAEGMLIGPYKIFEGGHPVPNEGSLIAGKEIIGFLSDLTEQDLVILLVSGGGSSLATAPEKGVSLEGLRELTLQLLHCGAAIDEINTLRRHLDLIKGGRLARMAYPAKVVSLIISDVVGDPLESIASGPTAPDPTTRQDAMAILRKYNLSKKVPLSVFSALATAEETPKPGNPVFKSVQNVVIGNNLMAAQAALRQAEMEGYHPYLLRTDLHGEASKTAVELCHILRLAWQTGDPVPRPACILAGGETTVTLNKNPGRGGRNTEMALAAVKELANFPEVMVITLATDGEDGMTDAAGAVVTGDTYNRAHKMGLNPFDYLIRNDSYSFFETLNDLLKPGVTGTNVSDLIFLFAL